VSHAPVRRPTFRRTSRLTSLAVVCAVAFPVAGRAECLATARVVCLDGGRFRVTAFFSTPGRAEKPANGQVLPANPPGAPHRAAQFSFADPKTVDLVVTLEDRCAAAGAISGAVAATTFAAFRVVVEDLERAEVRTLQRDGKPQRGTVRAENAFECPAP
jgi:hypothetical protein